MIDKPIYITAQGKEELETELAHLLQLERPTLLESLHEAQEGGDWRDNTEALLIQEELGRADGRIHELEQMLVNAQLIEVGHSTGIVTIGSTAVIQANGDPLERYTIVGATEADPEHGLISNESPLGRALLSHKIGDDVTVKAPDGLWSFRIVAVR
jgi:transcription elongation factor GreA